MAAAKLGVEKEILWLGVQRLAQGPGSRVRLSGVAYEFARNLQPCTQRESGRAGHTHAGPYLSVVESFTTHPLAQLVRGATDDYTV